MIAEGLALIDKAMRHRGRGPYQVQAAIAGAARPRGAARRHRLGRDRAALRRAGAHAALAGRHAQPRGRGLQGPRPGRGAGDDRAPGRRGSPAISTSSASRAPCCCSSAAPSEARVAFDRAIALANTAAEAAHIRQQLDRLIKNSAPSDDDARASS